MDISSLLSINSVGNATSTLSASSILTDVNKTSTSLDSGDENSDLFGSILGSAIDNLKTTNNYIEDAKTEKVKLAMGETENTHDLTIALQKASTALQYTVALRDKFLEAYKEIMQMQI